MTTNIFNLDHIIESYKLDELLNSERWDFLPKITKGATDQKTLATWWIHLTKNGCPLALQLTNGKYILWKIDERATDAEIASIRRDPKQRWFQE